jgi:hypothetical protein
MKYHALPRGSQTGKTIRGLPPVRSTVNTQRATEAARSPLGMGADPLVTIFSHINQCAVRISKLQGAIRTRLQ